MSGDSKDEKSVDETPTKPVKVGKSYRGQQFAPITTEEDVAEKIAAQKPFLKEGAISLETYFGLRGHRDPVRQAAMRAFVNINMATPEDWDAIFEKF